MDGTRTLFFFETDSVKVTLPNEKDATEYKDKDINVNSTGYLTDLKTMNETTQEFSFIFKNDELIFTFAWKKGESRYRLDKVTFVNGNNNMSDPIFTTETPDLRITGSKQFKVNTQGYQCGSLKISLDAINNNQTSTAQLELSNFKFAAFQNSTKTNYVECRQEPGSSVIPLAVGGGLLVFMGIAMVGYICLRNRAS